LEKKKQIYILKKCEELENMISKISLLVVNTYKGFHI